MENKRFKPLIDKLFWIIATPTILLLIALTVVSAFSPMSLFITVPIDLCVVFLLLSPLFGYVELRESSVFIKYGLLLKREIAYDKIREVKKDRRFYSDSMLSLKNAFEHVNIRYNAFDVTTVSVIDNDALIRELNDRCLKEKTN